MSNAIEMRNVCKAYPGFSLKNVSFTVPKGLCCGFVGANGAGKTTIIRMLAGLAYPDNGDISLLGGSADALSVKEEIGVLFDQPHFQEEWTPLDIEKGLRLFYAGWDSGQYRRYLSSFGLDAEKKFRDMSRGMKEKLAIAVHLSHNAKLLILDEPMTGLDPAARDELLEILRDYMVSEDRSILFSTHITEDLEHIADRIVYISNGTISYQGDKEDLTSSYCIVRGGKLPEEKKAFAIGLRQTASGYECLMALESVGGLPADTVTEAATIHDIVVYMERNEKYV
ncbi:MAG: ABC transporter ATP-binding protein [Lachnospiraceae bacterium]|nr:ABC transporter ATP-binding protein [Lachnospiraceae bacterium]MDE7239687.1 ABC transporter ATP-binding protein [Lachnospiraceae bacterium]